jgi:hypothetical protein
MPVINGVYLKDFAALPSAVVDANIIPIAITGDQIAYRTTVGGIVTDARVTSKLLTGLSVTGGAIAATDTILQAFGKVQNQINSKVSSVGLTMPSAFSVANSPITSAGTLAVTAAGVASQYIRGDGALADFPTNGGGGSSVSYYLNGSVSQGTIGGNAYYEMNKTPVIGTGTDFTIAADGYIAQFITDANDPASLLIPAGNWNVEMYFSASSSGGTPSFYVEVYKYNGTTFTLLGSSATTPEGITNGTAIDIYYTSVGIPETVLTITDRLAIRVYVTHSGRTITLHTEDNHLSEIVTTFSNGLTALNGLTKQAQYFAVGSTGTDFNISSSVDTHTFNIPSASASARGLITTGAQTIAGTKTFSVDTVVNGVNIGRGGGNIATNTANGNAALISNTTGADNTASGYQALYNNTIGGYNTAYGVQALYNNTIGLYNTASGYQALFSNTTGSTNTGNGIQALYNNTTGLYNTGNGVQALYNNTTGLYNTANGVQALYYNTTGLYNIGIGSQAGSANTTGSNNIFLGYNSTGESATESNRTWIGNTDTTSTWVGGNLLLGTRTNATSDKLQVTGSAKITGQLTLGSTITNGTYTYTLPSATGTLALTSDIHSAVTLSAIGSTPNANAATLTGQVLNLEPASASFGGVVTTGTQTFAGDKTFNDNISVSTSTANSAIQVTSTKADGRALSVLATSSLEPFSVTQNGAGKLAQFNNSAGAKFVIYNSGEFEANGGTLYANLAGTTANFTGQLTLGSTITNGTYTYTLPSATGTLALTSALSGYLPLTGGTLTGALSGTSATFSGDLTVDTNTLYVDSTNNKVGIGTTSPQGVFESVGLVYLTRSSQSLLINPNYGGANTHIQLQAVGNMAIAFATNGDNERMRITSGGNVLIGNATNSVLALSTFSKTLTTGYATANNYLQLGAGENGLNGTRLIGFGYSITANTNQPAYIGYIETSNTGETKGSLIFGTRDVTTDTAPTERMRITSGGNVGIGTTSPSKRLDVFTTASSATEYQLSLRNGAGANDVSAGIAFGFNSSSLDPDYLSAISSIITNRSTRAADLTFLTSATGTLAESMRITSGGNVLIGTATLVGQELVSVSFDSSSTYSQAINIKDRYASANNSNYLVFRKSDDAAIGSISRVGTTSAISYNTISDYRLKEDLKEINGLQKLSAIKVYDFKWKDNDARMDGVIAHELQEVLPYAVTGEKDAKEMQSVDYSKLVPVLVKAIQELSEKVKQLENK